MSLFKGANSLFYTPLQYKLKVYPLLWGWGIILGLGYLFLPGSLYTIILIGLCALVIGTIKPEYAYFLVILTLTEEMVHFFIRFERVYDVRFFPYIIFLLISGLGWMIGKVTKRIEHRTSTPIDGVLVAVVVYEVISILWSPHFSLGVFLSLFLITNFLLFYLTTAFLREENVLRMAVHFWIAAGIITATGIILSQWFETISDIYISNNMGFHIAFSQLGERPAGLAGVDHAAGFTNTAIAMTLGTVIYEKSKKLKIMYIFFILYMLFSVILTTSRGALIGLMGACAFFVLMHPFFKGKFIRYSFLFGVIIIFIILIAKPGFIDRMLIGFGYTGTQLFSEETGYQMAKGETEGIAGLDIRMDWWKMGLKEMIEKPLKLLFGLGIGGFIYYSKESPEVNSVSFAFFYDMGMFGMILFITFMYILVSNLHYYLKNGKKSYSYYILLASTTALIADAGIHGLVDYDLTSYGSKFFWFPLGFVMAVLNIVKAETHEDKKEDKQVVRYG